MTGVGTAQRKGHDISCPYKEKKEPGLPVKATGAPRKVIRGAESAQTARNANRAGMPRPI